MGYRLNLIDFNNEKRRKRLGVFLLLVAISIFLILPINSEAEVLDSITDAVTDSADMAQDQAHHAAKMIVLNAIKKAVGLILKAAQGLLALFKEGAIVSIIVDALARLLCDSAVDIIGSVIELFDSTDVLFFSNIGEFFIRFAKQIGWLLWIIGAGIAALEIGITYKSQMALGDHIKHLGLNIFKSLLAVQLFFLLPVQLYLFFSNLSLDVVDKLFSLSHVTGSISLFDRFDDSIAKIIVAAITIFCAFKIFLAVIKRAGTLLILITIGSLHMVSIPRGFWEGFWSWTKQVIALIATNFCQLVIFSAGVALTFGSRSLAADMAGLSCILAACEVPRIADRFGLDTSIKTSASSAISTMSTMVKFIK